MRGGRLFTHTLLLLVPLYVMVVADRSSSPCGMINLPLNLRGGGAVRVTKRVRVERLDEERGQSAVGLDAFEDGAPLAKVARNSWWNLWESRNANQNLLSSTVQFALDGAKRLLAWSRTSISAHQSGGIEEEKRGRIVFSGDNDRPSAIMRQIRFYFSDSNLPNDSFLKDQISKNPDGFVDLETISRFRRMKTLNATVNDIAAAARDVENLEVSQDGLGVRRVTPIPAEDVALSRTIYAKPFKIDSVGKVMEKIPAWFASCGRVVSVRMVRDFRNMKHFTGAAFIEFEDEEEAIQSTKIPVKVEGVTLEICMKRDWKRIERIVRQEERIDARSGDTKKSSNNLKTSKVNFHKGVFVKIEGMGYNVTRHEVASIIERYGKVKFVEMCKNGNTSSLCNAIVRFERASQARASVEDDDPPVLGGQVPKLLLVEGIDEEQENDKLHKRTAQLNVKVPFWRKKFQRMR